MVSYQIIALQIVFLVPLRTLGDDTGETLRVMDQELISRRLIAYDDTNKFFEHVHAFDKGYGHKWIVMPDGNGTAKIAKMQPSALTGSWTYSQIHKYVHFILFSPNDKDGVKFTEDSLKEIPYNNSYPTKIVCHGWMSSSHDDVAKLITNEYMNTKRVNVIVVDWSHISGDYCYPNAAEATKTVGKFLGNVIDTIVNDFNASYSDFHIIGHSLGAHVAGSAGSHTKERIKRITGLDPALPWFQFMQGHDGRLDSSDADFVDVIHTCSGILGMSIPIGHVDFYPNGGSPDQPGCQHEWFPVGKEACSHSRSYMFFAESIPSAHFKGVQCKDWAHFKLRECEENVAVMGENVSHDERGIFYLKTDYEAPFALDKEGLIF